MRSIRLLIMPSLLAGIIFTSCHKSNVTADIAVDAGNFQYIQIPVDSANLTGVVTVGQNIATVYSWTQISGPNTPVITNSSSLSTEVKGLTSGTYIFQFEASNGSGTIIGIDTTGVIVGGGSIILQPDSAHAKQSLAYSYIPNTPEPLTTEMPIWTWTVSSVPVYTREFIQFDLSGIPSGATIISARLSLYSLDTAEFTAQGGFQDPQYSDSGRAIGLIAAGFTQVNGNALSVKRITQNWDTNTLDWNNMPTSTNTNETIVPHVANGYSNATDINVTSLVQDMQTNGNNGFVIGLVNEMYYNQRDFASGGNADATRRPKLVIVYQ